MNSILPFSTCLLAIERPDHENTRAEVIEVLESASPPPTISCCPSNRSHSRNLQTLSTVGLQCSHSTSHLASGPSDHTREESHDLTSALLLTPSTAAVAHSQLLECNCKEWKCVSVVIARALPYKVCPLDSSVLKMT